MGRKRCRKKANPNDEEDHIHSTTKTRDFYTRPGPQQLMVVLGPAQDPSRAQMPQMPAQHQVPRAKPVQEKMDAAAQQGKNNCPGTGSHEGPLRLKRARGQTFDPKPYIIYIYVAIYYIYILYSYIIIHTSHTGSYSWRR